jgi:phage terminase large subunit-like protein
LRPSRREAFDRYDVARCYMDPHEWRSDIEALAEEFPGRAMPFATSRDTAMAAALDRLHSGLRAGEVWHSGDPVVLEHFGNAYAWRKGGHRLVRKEHKQSGRKIDAVVGCALALEARADALADGWGKDRRALTRVSGRVRSF